MIFKIGDQYFHPKDIPCAIIFIDEEEREIAGRAILDIQSYHTELNISEASGKTSCFSAHPPMTEEEFEKWSYAPDEELAKSTKQIELSVLK